MSHHKNPKYQIPALIESLKAHGLDVDEPSQLSDAFRFGYLAALRSEPEPTPEPGERESSLKWCKSCGEGVTTFCRGKQSPDWDYKCPVLNLPARASKGTP